jgi:fructosamine-3-kinase
VDDALRDRLAMLGTVGSARHEGGGDFATAYAVELTDGTRLFAKTHRRPPPGFFSTEAAGLRWLAEPGVVAVPEVVLVADDEPACLVLAWVDAGGRRTSDTEATFGRELAALHRSGAATFGRVDRRTTGSLALPNEPRTTWEAFYAECRLAPLVEIATDRGALSAQALRAVERVASRLGEYGAADEPPARLHGDLWAGNRLVDADGRSWLIDPAAHGGHREFDLAMMRLFGGFGDDAFRAYDDVHPLASGWEVRVDLHQLAPLIVHAIKFGGGYAGAVEVALERLGG